MQLRLRSPSLRELALLGVCIDSKLRACNLVRLRYGTSNKAADRLCRRSVSAPAQGRVPPREERRKRQGRDTLVALDWVRRDGHPWMWCIGRARIGPASQPDLQGDARLGGPHASL